ncbi:MAG: hypothetical protein IH597_01440 [Bacteroidales bacterium]|nr:hypothetical protein [Bacteroidales bacterium]
MMMVKADNNSTRIANVFSAFLLISPINALMISTVQTNTTPAIKQTPGGNQNDEANTVANAIMPENNDFCIQSMNEDVMQ